TRRKLDLGSGARYVPPKICRVWGGVGAMSAAVSLLNTKVLVLNRSYLPIHITSVKRPCSLLSQGVAHAVDEHYKTFDFQSWSDLALSEHDEQIGLINRAIRVP